MGWLADSLRRWLAPSPPDSGDEAAGPALDRALGREIDRLRRDVASAGQPVSGEAADRLARLLALRDANRAEATPPRRRTPGVVVAVATAAAVGALLFGRVDNANVEIVAQVTGFSFTSAVDQPLTTPIEASAVGITGVSSLRRPGAGDAPFARRTYIGATGGAFKVFRHQGAEQPGSVSLGPVMLAPETRVTVSALPSGLGVALAASVAEIEVTIVGDVAISETGAPQHRIALSAPAAIRAAPGPGVTALTIAPAPGETPAMSRHILATDLSFLDIEELEIGDATIVREISTIASGTLYLPDLGDRAYPLRPGATLRIDVVDGSISSLAKSDDGMALRFSGRASALRLGAADGRDLMPTYLEWLMAQHALSLFWGSSIYLIGLGLGLLRWLRA